MTDMKDTFKIVKLEEQLRSQHNHISAMHNFIEALSITLLDEEDHDGAVEMLNDYRKQQEKQ